jgi:hypothetical protein
MIELMRKRKEDIDIGRRILRMDDAGVLREEIL